ncbi:MAG: hypothetical protein JWN43_2943 [Gammaproteobacteria bacterium]|nr:hypothetical protein [Gammaproteobacteria bacterium]
MKRYLLLPFHGTPLQLVATFSVGLVMAFKAGLMGIPLGFLLLSWFFKYCFGVLDSIVAGEAEPPVLSIEMVNPISEQRPLALALLIILEGMLVVALQKYAGRAAGLCAVLVLAWALPANIAVLGVTRNPFSAIWPPTLFALIRALGWNYVLLNGVVLVAAGVFYWMGVHAVSMGLALIAMQLMFLLTFVLLAGTLFEHRLELWIESKTRQERMAERDAREHEAERRRMLDRAYSGFRVRKPLEGWQEIEAWLRQYGQGPPRESQSPDRSEGSPGDSLLLVEYRAVLEAASKWDDVRAADRLANDLVALLLAKRANGEVLSVVETRLATNPQFQVLPPAQALRVAELAGAAGKRPLQRRVSPKL